MTSRAGSRKFRFLLLALAALLLVWMIELGFHAFKVLKETEVEHADGMSVATLLDPQELRSLGTLDEDFGVTSEGVVVFRAGRQLFGVEPESYLASDLGLKTVPDKFAFDSADVMLTVSNGFLGNLSPEGGLIEGVPLAYPNVRLVNSVHPGAINLFGGKDGSYRFYRFLEDGSFQVLLEIDQPIVSVADAGDGTYAATADMIVRVAWPEPVVMFKAPQQPGWGPIQSVVAAGDGLVFFSTPTSIYALKDGIAVSVINDSGGSIRLHGDRLYVLDSKRGLLYTASPASMALFKGNKA